MNLVHVVRSEKEAELVFEPVRWEILRLLARESRAECEIASILNLSPPTIGHHLKALEASGLVNVAKKEVESHGIVKKFYAPSAKIYIGDLAKMSRVAKHYFMPARLERIRGMLAALRLDDGAAYKPTTPTVETIMIHLEPFLLQAAEHKEGPSNGEDPEAVVNQIYREALRLLLKSRPELFQHAPIMHKT